MTLEEAIKHCEEVAEKYDTELNLINCGISNESCDDCIECANEHRQLAEWLRELVHLRNITEYLRDMVTCFEFMDSMHYNEDIIEWAESELRVDMREVNADEDSDCLD